MRPFGGMKKMRTWFAADKTGFHMLHTLFQTSLKYTSVVRYDEWFVTKLLVDDGRVQGVVAIELMTGRVEAITARAVILCTGGCGRVFPFTTNATIKNGDGMALAYRAGAPLKDMEFVQYHPTGLPFTGILITEAARAEGGYLINKDGYRYLQDYNLGKPEPKPVLRSMELGPRDRLSQAFVKEVEKGRTIETPYGPVVHLDLRHLGREGDRREDPLRPRAVPEVPEHRPGEGADPGAAGGPLHDGRGSHRHRRRDAARGAVRRGRGGLREHQRRQPTGLQLAARAAGLRRPRRPGRRRVRLAPDADPAPAVAWRRPRTSSAGSRWSSPHGAAAASASPSSATRCRRRWRRAPASTAPESAAPRRSPRLRELQERCADVAIEDHSRTFNTERVAALELAFMLDVAEAIVHSALATRGVPRRPPADRLSRRATTSASWRIRWPTGTADGSCRVEYLPVTITRWPPGERVYGR